MNKLKYGIIGAGYISDKHLEGYAALDEKVSLEAICDIVEDRAVQKAEKYGIKDVYTDYGKLLARKDIDFVSICLPNHLHEAASVKAMESGKHVHCEKPMALNAKQAANMLEVSRRTGKKLMVGVNNRFTPQSQFIKNYIKSGNLGEIYYARCGWVRRAGLSYAGWFCNKELAGGGPLIDLGVHFIDLAMYYMDYPAVNSVTARTYSKFGMNDDLRQLYTFEGAKADFDIRYSVEDFTAGFVNLGNDACLNFEISWASNIESEKRFYEILGDKGGIKFEDMSETPALKIFTREHGQFVDIEPKIKTDGYNTTEFSHFIDSILNNQPPYMSLPEQSVEVMRLIDAAYESAEKSGRQIILS